MSCNTCGKPKCGCADAPLTTIPQFTCPPNKSCPTPPPCGEYIDSACVYYNDAGIVDLNIQEGASLQSIIQRLVLAATGNISCVTGACQATFNVYPVNITTTTITVGWAQSLTAAPGTTYQVQYKTIPALSWNVFPAQPYTDPTQLVITGLTTGIDYLVRVVTDCGGSSCNSVTLQIKTK
jgi:hypothetical protein